MSWWQRVSAPLAGAAAAQDVDVQKAVKCQTLVQQFGDAIKGAKAEDDVKKAASEQAKQGNQACNAHDYDAGMEQIRQAMRRGG